MKFTQVDIQSLPVSIIVCDHPSEVWECGRLLNMVKVDPDLQPVCLKELLYCLPPLVAFLFHTEQFIVLIEII